MKHEITLPSGLTIKTDIPHEKLWAKMLEYFARDKWGAEWGCPWCEGDIDSLTCEIVDDMFEDSYTCEGDCDLIITHITPKAAGEYHKVLPSEWTVMVENRTGSDANWYAPEDADDEPDGAK